MFSADSCVAAATFDIASSKSANRFTAMPIPAVRSAPIATPARPTCSKDCRACASFSLSDPTVRVACAASSMPFLYSAILARIVILTTCSLIWSLAFCVDLAFLLGCGAPVQPLQPDDKVFA